MEIYSAIIMFNILELIPHSINLVNSMTLLIESKAVEKSMDAQYNLVFFLNATN